MFWLSAVALASAQQLTEVGLNGPVAGAESRFMARLRRDALGPNKPAASASVAHPTGLLVVGDRLFASEFRRDRVLVAPSARAARDAGLSTGSGGWTVFAGRGRHCAEIDGVASCARLDGAWGLAAHEERELLFVSSFGSDEVLAFSLATGAFRFSLAGDLDCPEGLATSGDELYVASFLDSRLVVYDLDARTSRTLSMGVPVEVDFETLAGFVPRFDEAGARAVRESSSALWSENEGAVPFVDRLRGPEQIVVIGNSTLAVSSLHNDSVLEIDLRTGELIDVLADGAEDDRFSGPLGVAAAAGASALADAAPNDDCASSGDMLLVASYRSDAVSLLRRHCGAAAPLALEDKRLRGPTALALDSTDPGSLYIASYESSAVLYFNVSVDGERVDMLRRVAARME
mmetsp:Transcript_21570/g.64555  ORF Transcript_21570/g.64555 Transcript_21570/m.64555 type:complete len:403 (+) Transcript_21570:308-1516(+)